MIFGLRVSSARVPPDLLNRLGLEEDPLGKPEAEGLPEAGMGVRIGEGRFGGQCRGSVSSEGWRLSCSIRLTGRETGPVPG